MVIFCIEIGAFDKLPIETKNLRMFSAHEKHDKYTIQKEIGYCPDMLLFLLEYIIFNSKSLFSLLTKKTTVI